MNEQQIAAIEDVVRRLDAALTAHPRRMSDASDIKHEVDPWDYLPDLVAEVRRLRTAIRAALDDEESRPGGWGPDCTIVDVLRRALEVGS